AMALPDRAQVGGVVRVAQAPDLRTEIVGEQLEAELETALERPRAGQRGGETRAGVAAQGAAGRAGEGRHRQRSGGAREQQERETQTPGPTAGRSTRRSRDAHQMSRLRTDSAFSSMNWRRGSTCSPMRMVKMRSASTPSSLETRSRVRVSGFMV